MIKKIALTILISFLLASVLLVMKFERDKKQLGVRTDSSSVFSTGTAFYVNGTLGVGTSTPYSKLQVTSGGSGTALFATTTLTIGEIGTSTSASCINMKDSSGANKRVFIAGTSFVIQSGLCN